MAVPVACQHGTGLLRWSRSRTATSPAGAGRRNPISSRRDSPPRCRCRSRRCTSSSRRARAPTAATTPTTARWTPPCSPRPSAVRCGCNICATRAPAGIRRARPRPTRRGPALNAAGELIAYEFTSKAFLAGRRRHQWRQAVGHAGRAGAGRRAEIRRRLRRAGGILCRRQQAAEPGKPFRRCSTAPRRCAPRICAIRSDRKSTSPASPSSTKWRRR